MKKLYMLLCTVLVCCSLCACGKSSSSSDELTDNAQNWLSEQKSAITAEANTAKANNAKNAGFFDNIAYKATSIFDGLAGTKLSSGTKIGIANANVDANAQYRFNIAQQQANLSSTVEKGTGFGFLKGMGEGMGFSLILMLLFGGLVIMFIIHLIKQWIRRKRLQGDMQAIGMQKKDESLEGSLTRMIF